MNPRIRKAVLAAILVATVTVAIVDYTGKSAPTRASSPVSSGAAGTDAKAAGPSPSPAGKEPYSLTLPERAPLGEPKAELFSSNTWQPPVAAAPPTPPKPVAPPLPYSFAGKFVHGDEHSVMLSKGDLVFPVKVGETLDGAYRVESIGETQVTLIYLPLKQKQSIVVSSWIPPDSESTTGQADRQRPPAVASTQRPPATPPVASAQPGAVPQSAAAPAPGRATLSWRVPETIKVGEDVKVELIVKTDDALRSLPLQVSFDPDALQFVEAQEGGFFKQGGEKTSFAHNVDQANGRLFVGITRSGSGGAKGEDGLITIVFRAKAQKPKSELRVLAATAVSVGPSAVTVGLPQPQLLSVIQ